MDYNNTQALPKRPFDLFEGNNGKQILYKYITEPLDNIYKYLYLIFADFYYFLWSILIWTDIIEIKTNQAGKNKGLYTNVDLSKGSYISNSKSGRYWKMNNPMIDLKDFEPDKILTSVDFYKALKVLEDNYFDIKQINDKINVKIIGGELGFYAVTTKDLKANTELTRYYRYPSWIKKLFEKVTWRNLLGFYFYLNSLLPYKNYRALENNDGTISQLYFEVSHKTTVLQNCLNFEMLNSKNNEQIITWLDDFDENLKNNIKLIPKDDIHTPFKVIIS